MNLCDAGLVKAFLQKPRGTEDKLDRLDFSKILNFCALNQIVKRQPIE
jgi:hypothetical protein